MHKNHLKLSDETFFIRNTAVIQLDGTWIGYPYDFYVNAT